MIKLELEFFYVKVSEMLSYSSGAIILLTYTSLRLEFSFSSEKTKAFFFCFIILNARHDSPPSVALSGTQPLVLISDVLPAFLTP